eukprot:TRINITY_DN74203_c0_g1_i1.p1 TRINITY_DN74203_c0_g1~~TRINITY_DN74203_c0_g1_i1.p1  ORF type:complete len:411 (+),score=117.65 TRINITY_DN74203_c0_g1_i1:156-1388(+)
MADSSGFDAAPPPVGGLGNFKGVMLCNRPSDSSGGQAYAGDGPLPFRSMAPTGVGEQLGLTPCRNFEPTVKKRGPSAALRRHVKWLKDLQDQMKEEREQVEAEDLDAEERERRLKAAFHRHRDGVREMMQQRDEADAVEEKADMDRRYQERLRKKAEKDAAKAAKLEKERGEEGQGTKSKAAKPLWAMTEKEKEQHEEIEADELINFAEGLDYEKFINDIDFRSALGVVKDRAGRLQKEQDCFKDALLRDFNAAAELEEQSTSAGGSPRRLEDGLDGQSLLGDMKSEYSAASRRSAGRDRYGDGELQWDSSTACGEDRPQMDRETKALAEQVLESHSGLRAVHSKDSITRIIAKQKQAAEEPLPASLEEAMRRAGPAPVPVITTSADTQNLLHKQVDPSTLPYLYRSPAI